MDAKWNRPVVLSAMTLGGASYCAFIEPLSRVRLDERSRLSQWAGSFIPSLKVFGFLGVCNAMLGYLKFRQTENK